MVIIFDSCINILNNSTNGLKDVTEELLDNLDRMLTDCGIAHSFFLMTLSEIDKIHKRNPDSKYFCSLMYQEEDEVTVELVYALWTKLYRGASDEAIRNVFSKSTV